MTSRLDTLKARVAEQRTAEYPRPHVAWEDIERLVAVLEAYLLDKVDSTDPGYPRTDDALLYWLEPNEETP